MFFVWDSLIVVYVRKVLLYLFVCLSWYNSRTTGQILMYFFMWICLKFLSKIYKNGDYLHRSENLITINIRWEAGLFNYDKHEIYDQNL